MKKTFILFILLCLFSLPTLADGSVEYYGNASHFVFEKGSVYSPTDLFESFKGVMPGDTLTERITVRNKSPQNKVGIYMRALGAKEGSEDFLEKLTLTVKASGNNGYLFSAPASERATLADWVYLGTFYGDTGVDLDVTLNVPTDLGNEYQNRIGYLDWEFYAVEYPIVIPFPKPQKEKIKYRIEANYYTDGVLDNLVPLVILVDNDADDYPALGDVNEKYRELYRKYGGKVYEYRGVEYDGKTHVFTLTFTRSEKEDIHQKEYYEYFVKAQYYTNGDFDGETLILSEKVEAIPTISEIEERYKDSIVFGESEYEFTSVSIIEGGYILRFDRTYIPEEEDPKPPQTGDDTRLPLWISLALISFLCIVILAFILRRKKEEN